MFHEDDRPTLNISLSDLEPTRIMSRDEMELTMALDAFVGASEATTGEIDRLLVGLVDVEESEITAWTLG